MILVPLVCHSRPCSAVWSHLLTSPLQELRLQQGLTRTFPFPVWATPTLSSFPHRKISPIMFVSSSGPAPRLVSFLAGVPRAGCSTGLLPEWRRCSVCAMRRGFYNLSNSNNFKNPWLFPINKHCKFSLLILLQNLLEISEKLCPSEG